MEKEVLEILKSIQTDLKAVKDSQQRIEKNWYNLWTNGRLDRV